MRSVRPYAQARARISPRGWGWGPRISGGGSAVSHSPQISSLAHGPEPGTMSVLPRSWGANWTHSGIRSAVVDNVRLFCPGCEKMLALARTEFLRRPFAMDGWSWATLDFCWPDKPRHTPFIPLVAARANFCRFPVCFAWRLKARPMSQGLHVSDDLLAPGAVAGVRLNSYRQAGGSKVLAFERSLFQRPGPSGALRGRNPAGLGGVNSAGHAQGWRRPNHLLRV